MVHASAKMGLIPPRFLLPALQLRNVINEPTEGDMADALEAQPRDLHEAFYQTLGRIQEQPDGRKRLGMRILLWISHARVTLTVTELSESMAIRRGVRSLDPRRRPSEKMMIQCCLGLVTVDQESSDVRLVHYALQEFFQDQGNAIFPGGHDELAEDCLDYLYLKDFSHGCLETEAEIEQSIDNFPLLSYASSYWGHHVRLSPSDRTNRLALDFLHCRPQQALSIQVERFSQGYREEYWEPDEVLSHNAFHNACAFGLLSVVHEILRSENVDLNAATYIGTTPLIRAASSGHIELLKLLLSLGADTMKANWYGTALHCAAEAGQCDSIEILLATGMDVNLKNTFGLTPLHCATDRRYSETIRYLLKKGANPNVRDTTGLLLLHDAARVGDEPLVQMLLRDRKVDVSARTSEGATALHNAAIEGHVGIVSMLLHAGAIINARDKDGDTALHLAVFHPPKLDVVRLLIEAGADVNAEANDKSTPWAMAATAGHEHIQRLLEEHGAEGGVLAHSPTDSLLGARDVQ